MAQNFCGAPISVAHAAPCATECANVTPSPHISVAHAARCATDIWTFCGAPGTCATEIYFSGEISVAHPPGPGVRHRYLKWCATDSCFSSSACLAHAAEADAVAKGRSESVEDDAEQVVREFGP